MWLSSVVLPEPRKPVSTVTGTRESDEDDILDGRVTADDAVGPSQKGADSRRRDPIGE
jgi:hypothetical protein